MRDISNKLWLWILFVVSPLLCLLIAVKSYRTGLAKNIIWAFTIFYGVTFVISSEGIDSFEYAKILTEMYHRAMSFSEVAAQFYNEEEGALDFIQPLLTYLVSLFTDNYHILFGIFCVLFGFFYSRNIYSLIEKLKGPIKPEVLFLVFVFAMIVPVWYVNGVRMWTAAHIFFYGTYTYLVNNKKSSILWSITAVFMHFSFLFPVLILCIFIALGNRINVYFWLFIASFFLTQWDISGIGDLMESYLPAIFQNRVEGYTNVNYAENVGDLKSATNFYMQWYGPLLQYAVTGLLILAYWKGKLFFENNLTYKRLIGFTFLLYALSNLVSKIPSFGRFVTVSSLFALASIVLYVHFTVRTKLVSRVLPYVYMAMFLWTIVTLRIGLDTFGLMTIIGNPVTVFLRDTELPLIDFFK